jgi:DNA-binding MarR family transcriptional regulator
MAGKIQQEIVVTRTLPTEVEAFLNVQLTASKLLGGVAAIIKPFGLSTTQFNVLRILRGAGEDGMPCGEVSERLITRDSDITRLFDRLEKRNLITRERSETDRRVVRAKIAPEAVLLLDAVDQPILELHVRQFARLEQPDVAKLIDLLEVLR